ncbi:hypothetical protein EAI_02126 [Harpegnathos saltator]|uniref:Uncharacterized protein n=1 Tax=Harpegnathos saltator TaxID=610380 RepID=E2BAC6_HARSA|nr:hypothetical protein EAI_02126 [Harpegnathos saltator]
MYEGKKKVRRGEEEEKEEERIGKKNVKVGRHQGEEWKGGSGRTEVGGRGKEGWIRDEEVREMVWKLMKEVRGFKEEVKREGKKRDGENRELREELRKQREERRKEWEEWKREGEEKIKMEERLERWEKWEMEG